MRLKAEEVICSREEEEEEVGGGESPTPRAEPGGAKEERVG